MAFFVIELFLALLAQTNFNEYVFLLNIPEVDFEVLVAYSLQVTDPHVCSLF